MWRLLENRVLKTRFISLYITKQQHQQKPTKMKSDLEVRKKKKKTKAKKKPRKNQTPWRTSGRATQAAWAPNRVTQAAWDLGLARAWSCDPGHAAWVARPRSRGLGRATLGRASSLSLSLIWSPSLSSDLTLSLSLIWSDPVRWGCAWDLKFFKFFWFINWVLDTRFWSGHHVEKDATSDVIRT